MSWIIYAVRRRSAVGEGETPTASDDDVGGGRARVRERERFFVKISTHGGGRDERRRVRRRVDVLEGAAAEMDDRKGTRVRASRDERRREGGVRAR